MALGKRKRRAFKFLGLVVAGLAAGLGLLPVWFPWVLRPIAKGQGIHYAGYERHGYSRFALRGVTFQEAEVTVRAEQAEAWIPSVWIWRWWRNDYDGPYARVSGWQVEIAAGKASSTPGSLSRTYRDVGDVVRVVKRWLPTATLSNGIVRAPGFSLEIAEAAWSAPNLRAKVGWNQRALVVSADLRNVESVEARIESEALALKSKILALEQNGGLQVVSTSYWRSNQVEVAAHFALTGMLPDRASLRAINLVVPNEFTGMTGYQPLNGTVTADWTNGGFVLDANADAVAQAGETNLPSAKIRLHARGDTNGAVVESAFVSLPWLEAELSHDLKINYTGALLREPAAFKFSADLAGQPWVWLEGKVNGEADLSPGTGKIPQARFQVSGQDVGNKDVQAKAFEATGSLDWPWLEVQKARADFEEGKAWVSGKMDLDRRVVSEGSLVVQIRGAGASGLAVGDVRNSPSPPPSSEALRRAGQPSRQGEGAALAGLSPSGQKVVSGTPSGENASGNGTLKWLPLGYSFDSLSVTGRFQGPLRQLGHSGHLEVAGLVTPDLRPLRVLADWEGEATRLSEAEVRVGGTNSALFAKGSVALDANGIQAVLKRLSLTKLDKAVLELEAPSEAVITGLSKGTNGWAAQLDSFSWRGAGGKIQAQGSVHWPQTGEVQCAIENVGSDLFDGFLKPRLQESQIRNLNVSAGWTNGPLAFIIDLEGTVVPPKDIVGGESNAGSATNFAGLLSDPVEVNLKLRGDQRGVVLSNVVVLTRTSAVVVARGFLPLTFTPPRPTNIVALDLDGPLSLTASTQPHAFFWGKVADWTGLVLREPRLEAEVAGTWKAPQGEVRLTALQILFPVIRSNAPPALDKVRLAVQLNRERAQIADCQMLLQGQPVTLTGEMPLGESFWRGLREKQIPNWEQATARLSMENAEVAAFAPLLPEIISPAGKLNLEASLRPGGHLTGGLKIEGARMRPLPGVGAIRDITVDVQFVDRDLKLASASGQIGGTRINVAGWADLRGTNWLRGAVPPFEVSLKGTNVPLSRQPDSIVRSDLDLTIRKTNNAPAVISGAARLQNSYYLSDLADLMPGRVASPEQRPPFFSIPQEPLANWRVNVHVTGSRWLRVRSTVFNGEVSANFRLIGTLEEPVALGDVRIEAGTIRFPFASLKVQQGFVTLSSQDPYHPQLQVTASSKEYGYDINLQITGSADSPIVQFTSVPPLSSEQIVLLVTAGTVPTQSQITSEQRAETMAVFLGRDLLSRLGYGDTGESRLNIHSGQDVTEAGRPTYNVEYKLTERWSLVGEYDRFNAFNAGFKWKIYSK